MNYEISVEGGFTGISRLYEGELKLTEAEKNQLLRILKENPKIQNENSQMRDGLNYRIKLIEENMELEVVFDEKTLPKIIRKLIDENRLKK